MLQTLFLLFQCSKKYIDFWPKSCFLEPTIFKIPQPNWYFHTLDLYLSNLKGNNECALTCQATWSMHDNADARWKKTKKKLLWKKTAKLSFGYKRFTILVRSSSVVWVGTKVSSEKKLLKIARTSCNNWCTMGWSLFWKIILLILIKLLSICRSNKGWEISEAIFIVFTS